MSRTETGKFSQVLDRYEPKPVPPCPSSPADPPGHRQPCREGVTHFKISSVCKEGDSCFLFIKEIMLIGPPNAGLL